MSARLARRSQPWVELQRLLPQPQCGVLAALAQLGHCGQVIQQRHLSAARRGIRWAAPECRQHALVVAQEAECLGDLEPLIGGRLVGLAQPYGVFVRTIGLADRQWKYTRLASAWTLAGSNTSTRCAVAREINLIGQQIRLAQVIQRRREVGLARKQLLGECRHGRELAAAERALERLVQLGELQRGRPGQPALIEQLVDHSFELADVVRTSAARGLRGCC